MSEKISLDSSDHETLLIYYDHYVASLNTLPRILVIQYI